jgi:hypothetical protein
MTPRTAGSSASHPPPQQLPASFAFTTLTASATGEPLAGACVGKGASVAEESANVPVNAWGVAVSKTLWSSSIAGIGSS